MKLIGVAGDNVDVGDRDAKLFGDDLGERCEMPLSLCADAGSNADTAVALHLHPRAFIRPNAGAFDIADNA